MNPNNHCFYIVSWNVRGLDDPDKCTIVRNALRDANPSLVCLQETKLACINAFKAKSILPSNLSSSFVFAPADGTRGGMLIAWDPSLFSIQNSFNKPYTITAKLRSTTSNLDFTITNAYGPSDHTLSNAFLQHLQELPMVIQGPWIVLGDFNLVRCAADKNNRQFNAPLATAFNDTIDQLNLSEVDLGDRLYTWSNRQANPILAKLDRVFSNNELNLAFPLATLSSLPRPTSDHTPLLLTLSSSLPKAGFFRFECFWLQYPSFLPSVLPAWGQAPVQGDAVGQLAACIKSTRTAAKVWSRCFRAPSYLIKNFQFIIQLFDFLEETRSLSSAEFQVRDDAQVTLHKAIKAQATYWKQRSKHKAIREADANTAFHHAQATQRLRRNCIRLVRVDGRDIVSHEGKTAALTDFFKGIIGNPGLSVNIDLDSLFAERHQPSATLIGVFTEEEARQALFSMDNNSAPGPDGFGLAFFRATWNETKGKIMDFLHAFHRGDAQLERINRSHVVLLPKKPGAIDVDAFRPICPGFSFSVGKFFRHLPINKKFRTFRKFRMKFK